MEKYKQVFKNVSNEGINISKAKKEQLKRFIKAFLTPYQATKFLHNHSCIDIKSFAETILGFKIGLQDFLIIMLNEGFPIKPSTNENIVGYYKIKPDLYKKLYAIVESLKENNFSISLKENNNHDKNKNTRSS